MLMQQRLGQFIDKYGEFIYSALGFDEEDLNELLDLYSRNTFQEREKLRRERVDASS